MATWYPHAPPTATQKKPPAATAPRPHAHSPAPQDPKLPANHQIETVPAMPAHTPPLPATNTPPAPPTTSLWQLSCTFLVVLLNPLYYPRIFFQPFHKQHILPVKLNLIHRPMQLTPQLDQLNLL